MVGAGGVTGLVETAPAVVLVTEEVAVGVAWLKLVAALRAWKAAALLLSFSLLFSLFLLLNEGGGAGGEL